VSIIVLLHCADSSWNRACSTMIVYLLTASGPQLIACTLAVLLASVILISLCLPFFQKKGQVYCVWFFW